MGAGGCFGVGVGVDVEAEAAEGDVGEKGVVGVVVVKLKDARWTCREEDEASLTRLVLRLGRVA